ncbi:MAG: glutamate--tRNA ligase [Bdellovibrionales bacterium]|nr:glutamate--tRNA ligase [Bdellovibrionales bacterium]
MNNNVRVRFAPSPTGHLHVGGARTALFNYLFAKSISKDSKFILRVEDTDKERSSQEFLKSQLKDLNSLGITPDEGVFLDGDDIKEKDDNNNILDSKSTKSYKQSKRSELNIYKEKIDFLLQNGLAYYCFLTDEEIDTQKTLAKESKSTQQITSPYRPKNLEDAKTKNLEATEKISKGLKPSIRFNTISAKPEYIIKDLVRGEVKLPSNMVGDFVIQRSNGMPVYNFCCVVDDALMNITHVLRAEEHLSNTLRQLMIYEALNFTIPQFAHMSLILGEDKKKLSKRHGATSVEDYIKEGYLPEALINFLCLLGWSHPESKEIFSIQEAAKVFDLKRLNSAPAVFDTKKLLWMNGEYIKKLSPDDLKNKLNKHSPNNNHIDQFFTLLNTTSGSADVSQRKASSNTLRNTQISILQNSIKTLVEAKGILNLIFGQLNITDESNEVLSWNEAKDVLEFWIKQLNIKTEIYLTEEEFIDIQDKIKQTCKVKGKTLFMPLRVAVIGKPHGAELKEIIPLILVSNLINRAEQVLKTINKAD